MILPVDFVASRPTVRYCLADTGESRAPGGMFPPLLPAQSLQPHLTAVATDELPLAQHVATPAAADASEKPPRNEADASRLLGRAFGVDFHLFDVQSGRIVHCSRRQPLGGRGNWAELCREVARRGQPEFIDEENPFVVLAIPLGHALDGGGSRDCADSPSGLSNLVAAATFVVRPVQRAENLSRIARILGYDASDIAVWARRQTPWTPKALRRAARQFIGRLADRRQIAGLTKAGEMDRKRIEDLIAETQSLSENLSSTYEEISLLYRLTQNLKLSEGDQYIGQMALEWLAEVVPAETMVLVLLSVDADDETLSGKYRTEQLFLTHGKSPADSAVDAEQLLRLVEHLGLNSSSRPFVANPPVTAADAWPCPRIRQAVIVPLAEGDNVFGWLAAINHVDANQTASNETAVGAGGEGEVGKGEFGTVEASLLGSVGAILGIHSGNIDLYRQQSEMFSGVVRALTSAIDAKDRYTRGHSDRVARISVRLATELGCSEETINNIYLAGLLHDIGKIGIDDSVLRKPDKLSDEEYEHIKSHVEVGHRILLDLKQMDEVLPVVLHHHESWDGGGYPHRLPHEEIPLSARIVAVADSYDAMSSDRPYRKGMPEGRIDGIFREGSGKQWDPCVVEAFFSARADICEIADRSPDIAAVV